jgi:hypothetical protein
MQLLHTRTQANGFSYTAESCFFSAELPLPGFVAHLGVSCETSGEVLGTLTRTEKRYIFSCHLDETCFS